MANHFVYFVVMFALMAQPSLSEYVATDNVAPTISFHSPVDGQNFINRNVLFNVTIDGTGSPLREVFFNVLGDYISYASETDNMANCAPIEGNNNSMNCYFYHMITDGPSKVFSVLAYDYGIAYPGNMAERGVIFSVNSKGSPTPVIVPNVTEIVNVTTNSTNTTTGNSTNIDNKTGGGGGGGGSGSEGCSEGAKRCYGSAVQSCTDSAWSLVQSCELGCNVKTKSCFSEKVSDIDVSFESNKSAELNETKNETSFASSINTMLEGIYQPIYAIAKDNLWVLWYFALAIVIMLAILLKDEFRRREQARL